MRSSDKKVALLNKGNYEIRDLLGELAFMSWPYTQNEPVIREHTEGEPDLRSNLLVKGVCSQNLPCIKSVSPTLRLNSSAKKPDRHMTELMRSGRNVVSMPGEGHLVCSFEKAQFVQKK